MSNRAKKIIPWVLSVLLFVFGIFFYAGVTSQAQNTERSEQAKIAELRDKISKAEKGVESKASKSVKNTTGYDAKRVAKDDATMNRLAKSVFTWDDSESYVKARNTAKESFGFSDDNPFLTKFMPEVKSVENRDGKKINDIDANGANMSYESLSSYVTKISGGTYSYATIVSVTGANSNGAEADGSIMLFYDTDANGNVSNVSAQTLSE